jgi:hypothetical protein
MFTTHPLSRYHSVITGVVLLHVLHVLTDIGFLDIFEDREIIAQLSRLGSLADPLITSRYLIGVVSS